MNDNDDLLFVPPEFWSDVTVSLPTSGSNYLHGVNYGYGNIDVDALWNQMYVNPRPVIIICAYCKAHNALTNPTCVQCGAPMGVGVERR